MEPDAHDRASRFMTLLVPLITRAARKDIRESVPAGEG